MSSTPSAVQPTSHVLSLHNVMRDDLPDRQSHEKTLSRMPRYILINSTGAKNYRITGRRRILCYAAYSGKDSYCHGHWIQSFIRRKHHHRWGYSQKAGILPMNRWWSQSEQWRAVRDIRDTGKKGEICLNGPTARKGIVGDRIIIFCYSYVEDSKLKGLMP